MWTGASAHSPMITTLPADGETLAEVPEKVTITFKRNLRLTKVIWTHAGLHAHELELNGQTSFSTDFTFPFEGKGSGAYVIEWRGLGDDGHPQNGTFGFSVK